MDKTEEQIAKERAAVEAMKNAKANMDGALQRIATLERALGTAREGLIKAKSYIPADAYGYRSEKTRRDEIDEIIATVGKAFGG